MHRKIMLAAALAWGTAVWAVNWDEAMRRSGMYRDQEAKAKEGI